LTVGIAAKALIGMAGATCAGAEPAKNNAATTIEESRMADPSLLRRPG
jgi:hypothetical protein